MLVNVISEISILEQISKGMNIGTFSAGGIDSAVNNFKRMMDNNNIAYTCNSIKSDYDILDVHTIGPFSLYLIKKAKKNRKKVIIHSHTTFEDLRNSEYLGSGDFKGIKRYIKKFYSLADVIVSPSEYTMNLLKQNYNIKNPIAVISNGVVPENFKFSQELRDEYRKKYELNSFTVFGIGHAFRRKGIRSFVRVGRVLKNFDFIWYGRKYLSSIPEIENLPDNIKFPGYAENIRAAYSSGDCFFFPTYEENQGIVMLEAASCKRPIVVRDIPVFSEFENGKHCLKASDNNGFVECINKLAKHEKLRKKIALNAYNLIIKKHDLKVVGKKFSKLINSLF